MSLYYEHNIIVIQYKKINAVLGKESPGTVEVQVELKSRTGSAGTVAMIQNEDGTLTPMVDSYVDGNILNIPLSGTSSVVIVDNAKSYRVEKILKAQQMNSQAIQKDQILD